MLFWEQNLLTKNLRKSGTNWSWAVPRSVMLKNMVEVVVEVSSWSCNSSWSSTTFLVPVNYIWSKKKEISILWSKNPEKSYCHTMQMVTAWHFEFWCSVLKYEGYLTPMRSKLIRYFAGNIIKTKNDLSKPHTVNYRPKWKKVTAWHKMGF